MAIRPPTLALPLALAWLLAACGTPLGAVARRQFAQDHRCDAEDVSVQEDNGRYRVAGCGRRVDYVCAAEPSTSVLEDRARCEPAVGQAAPWGAPPVIHAAAAPREPRGY